MNSGSLDMYIEGPKGFNCDTKHHPDESSQGCVSVQQHGWTSDPNKLSCKGLKPGEFRWVVSTMRGPRRGGEARWDELEADSYRRTMLIWSLSAEGWGDTGLRTWNSEYFIFKVRRI